MSGRGTFFGVVLGVLVIILAFQNCSKNGFVVQQDLAMSLEEILFKKAIESDVVIPDSEKAVVLVEDAYFDFSPLVFKDKIKTSLKLVCEKQVSFVVSDNAFKKHFMATITAEPLEDCTISEDAGLSSNNEFLNNQEIEKWNQGILSKTMQVSEAIQIKVINWLKNLPTLDFHGTTVSSHIAYQNPRVKLVTLSNNKYYMGDYFSFSRIDGMDVCIANRNNIDAYLELLRDDTVRNAYINRPLSVREKLFYDLLESEQVQIYNASISRIATLIHFASMLANDCFGGLVANGVLAAEKQQIDSQFTDAEERRIEYARLLLDRSANWTNEAQEYFNRLKSFYALKDLVDSEREEKLLDERGLETLIVRSAGNDAALIDDFGSDDSCSPNNYALYIGSVDLKGEQTSFTNYGNCVDYYVLGEELIAAYPTGVLASVSGTSYSAPLFTRLLSQLYRPGDNRQSLIEKVKKLNRNQNIINPRFIASELAVNDTSRTLSQFAKMQNGEMNDAALAEAARQEAIGEKRIREEIKRALDRIK